MSGFAECARPLAPASERLYLQAVMGFYRFLAAEQLASPALPRLQQIIKLRARKTGQRLPQFPREAIERVLREMQGRMQNAECRMQNGEAEADGKADGKTDAEADAYTARKTNSEAERLRFLRDRAFLLTLADTACGCMRPANCGAGILTGTKAVRCSSARAISRMWCFLAAARPGAARISGSPRPAGRRQRASAGLPAPLCAPR